MATAASAIARVGGTTSTAAGDRGSNTRDVATAIPSDSVVNEVRKKGGGGQKVRQFGRVCIAGSDGDLKARVGDTLKVITHLSGNRNGFAVTRQDGVSV
jgi:hypothetical protein